MIQFNAVPSNEFSRSLKRGAVLVFLFIVLSHLVLDGGLTSQITLMAVLGFLGGTAVIVACRPLAPSAFDLWLLRWGFVPLWIAAQVATRCAWSWMGRL